MPSKPALKSSPPEPSPEPSMEKEDRILTVRLAPELYETIITEAKAARHSINSAATILLEEAWKGAKNAPCPAA